MDPLLKDFPWYSSYHYAGNTPIWAIDIDGLEPGSYANFKLHTPLTLIQQEAYQSIQKFNNSKAGRITSGVANTAMGLTGAIISGTAIAGTDGGAAPFGALTAFQLSLGEVALGVIEIVDAFKNDASKRPDANTILGRVAIKNGLSPKAIGVIDAFGGILPALLTGGASYRNPLGIVEAAEVYLKRPNIINTLNLIDNVFDALGFARSALPNEVKGRETLPIDEKRIEGFDVVSVNIGKEVVSFDKEKGTRTTTVSAKILLRDKLGVQKSFTVEFKKVVQVVDQSSKIEGRRGLIK